MFHRDFYESQEPGQISFSFFSLSKPSNHNKSFFFSHDTFSCTSKCKRNLELHRNHVWPHEHIPGGRYRKTPPSRRQLALRYYCSYEGGCVFMLVCLSAGFVLLLCLQDCPNMDKKTRKNASHFSEHGDK